MDAIAIVGAGAVGLYYGGRLAAAGEDVRFLVRGDHAALRRDGLRVASVAGDFAVARPAVFREPREIGPVGLVVVTWKATSNHMLGRVLPPLLHPGTRVLTLQNGLGNCEALARVAGAGRVLGGLCFVCLNRVAPGVVRHTAGGMVTVGPFGPGTGAAAAGFVRRLAAAGVPCELTDDLGATQWRKLVWNVPFNGLAIAAGGVTTADLLATPAGEAEVRALMAEVIAAARALGFQLDDGLVDWNVERTRPMGDYRPSSMLDFVAGREVEVEAIWAEPIRRARAAGVAVPRMEQLLERIREQLGRRPACA